MNIGWEAGGHHSRHLFWKTNRMKSFRVVIISNSTPRSVWRLAQRVEQEVPEARVCGILFERPRRGARSLGIGRIGDWIRAAAIRVGQTLLRWAHACPANPNGEFDFAVGDLVSCSRAAGWPTLLTEDIHTAAALDFIRQQTPDLGIAYGTRFLQCELFAIPRCGAFTVRKGAVPWEGDDELKGMEKLLDGEKEIRVTVQRVKESLEAGAAVATTTIQIQPYDTLTSLRLKADLIGNDLLVQAVARFARGPATAKALQEPSRRKATRPHQLLGRQEKQVERARVSRISGGSRPLWKMVIAALFFSPYLILRNWRRRLRGRFPVIVLFHHLVSDRPHHLGIPTDVFLRQVRFLQRHYRILSLAEAVEQLRNDSVKVPSVVLTFDDGYGENFFTLRAVMEETGVPVACFVCTQLVEEQRGFAHDLSKGQKDFPPFTWEQLVYLAANGMEIGSHTRSHLDCGSTDPVALEREIVGSKDDLERHLQRPANFFAFPLGWPRNMSAEAVEVGRATYPHLLSACGGENFSGEEDLFYLLHREFLSGDLWELELTLQSMFELTTALKRAIGLRTDLVLGSAEDHAHSS